LPRPHDGHAPGAVCGTARPTTTNLSYASGETVADAAIVAIVAVGKDGTIDVYNSGLRPTPSWSSISSIRRSVPTWGI
jgi:hypothetical protein